MTSNALPTVSIVVTTRNEERHIRNCLISIRSQVYPNIEIIVVDNNSSDMTKSIALEYTDLVFNLGPERAAQRNFGLREISTGSYLMYIDADMVLSPDVVSRCVEKIHDKNFGLVSLYVDEQILGEGWFSVARRFERSFYTGTIVDGSRFFRREAFLECGGFDEQLPPGTEDWDLDLRIRKIGKIGLLENRKAPERSWASTFADRLGCDDAHTFVGIFHNESKLTLRLYISKKNYYTESLLAYNSKWNGLEPIVSKQISPIYRLVGVFLIGGKWRRVARHPAKASSVFLLRILVGLGYVTRKLRITIGNLGK